MKKLISIILIICSFVMLFCGCGEPKEIYLKPEEEATVNFFKRKYKSIDEGEEESIKNEVVEFLTFEGKTGVAKLNTVAEVYGWSAEKFYFHQKGRRISIYNQINDEAIFQVFYDFLDGKKNCMASVGDLNQGTVYWAESLLGSGDVGAYWQKSDIDGVFRNLLDIRIKSLKDLLRTITYENISTAEGGNIIKINIQGYNLATFSKTEGKYKKFNVYFSKNELGEIIASLIEFKFDFGDEDYGDGAFTWQTNLKPTLDENVLWRKGDKDVYIENQFDWFTD